MARQKSNSEVNLEDVKKSIDRLAVIELIKAGAAREQIREIVGPISNQTVSQIRQAMKKMPGED